MPDLEKVLVIARKELNYSESPPNSNRTKYGKWYGLDGNPWCMMFIMWVFSRAGGMDLLPIRTASCGELMRAAQKKGNWHTGSYQPGDIVIFDFPGNQAKTDHVGLVESVSESGVITIEGNTGVGNDADGGKVMRRSRKNSVILGAFRPNYSAARFPTTGSQVRFTGHTQYGGQEEGAPASPASPCTARVEVVVSGAAHPYFLLGDNVEGWVNAEDVERPEQESAFREEAPTAGGDVPEGEDTDSAEAETETPEPIDSAAETETPEPADGAAESDDGLIDPPDWEVPDDAESFLPQPPETVTFRMEPGQNLRLVEVTAQSAAIIRSGPGVRYGKLSGLKTGTVVSITEESDGWGKLEDGGWISLRNTKDVTHTDRNRSNSADA